MEDLRYYLERNKAQYEQNKRGLNMYESFFDNILPLLSNARVPIRITNFDRRLPPNQQANYKQVKEFNEDYEKKMKIYNKFK